MEGMLTIWKINKNVNKIYDYAIMCVILQICIFPMLVQREYLLIWHRASSNGKLFCISESSVMWPKRGCMYRKQYCSNARWQSRIFKLVNWILCWTLILFAAISKPYDFSLNRATLQFFTLQVCHFDTRCSSSVSIFIPCSNDKAGMLRFIFLHSFNFVFRSRSPWPLPRAEVTGIRWCVWHWVVF